MTTLSPDRPASQLNPFDPFVVPVVLASALTGALLTGALNTERDPVPAPAGSADSGTSADSAGRDDSGGSGAGSEPVPNRPPPKCRSVLVVNMSVEPVGNRSLTALSDDSVRST